MGHLPDSSEPSYDPARAKELLAKAGFPNGVNVTLYSPSAVDRDAMTAVHSMLEAVGFKVDIEFPETGRAIELRTKGWEGLYAVGVAQLSNISSTLSMYFDPSSYYYYPSTWRPEELTDDYYVLRTTALVEEKLMQDFCRVLDDIKVCIPMYDGSISYVVRKGLEGHGFGTFGAGTEWSPPDTWWDR
jgi:ABC-type transport system substrate-binding protein